MLTIRNSGKGLFADKQKSLPRDIILVVNGKLISDELEVAEKLNNFFIEAVENHEIEPYLSETKSDIPNENNHEIIDQYKNHPNIVKIKENVGEGHNFFQRYYSSRIWEGNTKIRCQKGNTL